MSSWARAFAAYVPLALALALDAFAGNVEVVQQGTTLKVTGDFDAAFNLAGSSQPNRVRVSGFSATTVNGGMAALNFLGVESMKVTLGDGSTYLNLYDLDLEGGISIKGGAGSDRIELTSSEIGGDISVTGGLGELDFSCLQATVVDGKLSVKGGPGDDNAFLGDHCDLHGSVKIALSSGSNQVIAYSNFARSLAISGGDGSDFINFFDGAVGEKLDFRLGDGVNILASQGNFGVGRLSYKGGSDPDIVECRAIQVEEIASIQLGNGENSLRIEQQSEIGESLRVSAGRDRDFLTIIDTSIGEDAKLGLGSGNNTAAFVNVLIGDDLSVTAGSGDDVVTFAGAVAVGGTTKFQLDGGTNTP